MWSDAISWIWCDPWLSVVIRSDSWWVDYVRNHDDPCQIFHLNDWTSRQTIFPNQTKIVRWSSALSFARIDNLPDHNVLYTCTRNYADLISYNVSTNCQATRPRQSLQIIWFRAASCKRKTIVTDLISSSRKIMSFKTRKMQSIHIIHR